MNHAFPAAAMDTQRLMMYEAQKKSVGLAYLIWFFLGSIGGHRFYAGRTGSGLAMLILCCASFVLTFVVVGLLGFFVLGIWVLVDALLIPGMIRDHNMRLVGQLHR
ncbi:MAG TPA: TM2 domain-containing protein [Longimicrobium sp.]|uniref:TM2 domain-containing protein n=1 Tax=Longimicrobium sp. TaxID=2029185 RepID=UPI002ED7D601